MGVITVIFKTYNQILLEWKIQRFFPFNNYVQSPLFAFLDELWCLQLVPNRRDDDFISLYLARRNKNSPQEKEFSFLLGIKSADMIVSSEFVHIFKSGDSRSGSVEFVDRDDLVCVGEEYDDAMKVYFMAREIDDESETRSELPWSSFTAYMDQNYLVHNIPPLAELPSLGTEDLSKDLKESFLNERLYDVQIKVKDRHFKAHKFVLAARSTVFAAMFDHEMTERLSGVIDINDCDPDTFQDFLLALYTGKYDHLTSKSSLGLFKIADRYDFKHLRNECSNRLSSELSVDGVCDVIQLATLYNESEMLKNATEFFVNNAREVVTTERWKTFMTEYSSLASELIIKIASK